MEFAQNPIFRFIFQKKLHFAFTYSMIVGGGIPVTYAVPSHPRSVFGSFSSFTAHICTNFSENHLKFGLEYMGKDSHFCLLIAWKSYRATRRPPTNRHILFQGRYSLQRLKTCPVGTYKKFKQSNKTSLRYDSKHSLWCLFIVRKIA